MTQAEQETIAAFCRELALALRRITGKNIPIHLEDFPGLEEGQSEQLEDETIPVAEAIP